MMDVLYDIFISLFNAGLMIYTFILFFGSFSKHCFSKFTYILCILSIIAIYTLILIVWPPSLLRTGMSILIIYITTYLFRLKWFNRILLATLAFVISCIAEQATTVIISFIFSITTQAAISGYFSILGIVISKIITLLIVIIVRYKKHHTLYRLPIRKSLAIFLIPIFSLIILLVHTYLFTQLPIESESLGFSIALSYALLAISNIVVFDIVDRIYIDSEKDIQITTANEIITTQAEQYRQLHLHNAEIHRIKHDHKNFLIGLSAELKSQNYDTVLEALQNEQERLNMGAVLDHENGIITTVVQSKSEIIERSGIFIDFSYQELQKIKISSIDIAIILGNALDNAIEAVQQITEGKRKIDIMVKVTDNLIVMSIKNSVKHNIDTNNLKTTKTNKRFHGFGIISMQNLAKKYSGDIIFTCKNLVFETHIILHNSEDQ